MAMIHHLYIGHFIIGHFHKENELATSRPIDKEITLRLLRKQLGESADPDKLPSAWTMSIEPNLIVCDYFGAAPEALDFAADYAECTEAIMFDAGCYSRQTPEQVRQQAVLQRRLFTDFDGRSLH
ncbi:MAG: hypothetical protein FJ271_20635 [Planctomycetes bacterium]|nr:hypothetical protein [Planctomycetota bacterium]